MREAFHLVVGDIHLVVGVAFHLVVGDIHLVVGDIHHVVEGIRLAVGDTVLDCMELP